MNLIDKIDCVGDLSRNGKNTNRICAASGTSYFQKDSWTIFFTSSAMKVKNKKLKILIICFIDIQYK